jgi:phi13 family phage major tail protein
MATIGIDSLYYATITEDSMGLETYGTPQILAKAIKADLSIELAEAVLHADDGVVYSVKEFQAGTLKLGTADLSPAVVAILTGAHVDDNGVLISTSEDGGATVAIGFRAKKPEEVYRLFWLYKCKFGIPSVALETKGDSISFKTPELEATVMRRNRPDSRNRKPWKAEVVEGDPGVSTATISGWFDQVYEPVDQTV